MPGGPLGGEVTQFGPKAKLMSLDLLSNHLSLKTRESGVHCRPTESDRSGQGGAQVGLGSGLGPGSAAASSPFLPPLHLGLGTSPKPLPTFLRVCSALCPLQSLTVF